MCTLLLYLVLLYKHMCKVCHAHVFLSKLRMYLCVTEMFIYHSVLFCDWPMITISGRYRTWILESHISVSRPLGCLLVPISGFSLTVIKFCVCGAQLFSNVTSLKRVHLLLLSNCFVSE